MHIRFKEYAFTLIELLVVVGIISLLAAIATSNFRLATRRALKSADAANMKVIGSALQQYYVDYNTLPFADRTAGPFQSNSAENTGYGNGPASGGSWDGLPWVLYEAGYLKNWQMLFTNVFIKQYSGGITIHGNFPRYHNFRYAYNSSALSSGGHSGGSGNILQGNVWIIRNLYLDARSGFYASSFPNLPADYTYPWGEGNYENKVEHVMYSDMSVKTVIGGKDIVPPQ